MKHSQKILALLLSTLVLVALSFVTVEAAGRTYVQYCSGSLTNLRCGNGYQNDIDDAERNASVFMNQIERFSDREQEAILKKLTMKLSIYHTQTSDTLEQVIISYYHDYFSSQLETSSSDASVEDLIQSLINGSLTTSSTSRSTSTYTSSRSTAPRYDDGEITSVTSDNRYTSIRNGRVTVSYDTLGLKIYAKDGREVLNDSDGYRVVAVLEDTNRVIDTVAANDDGSYWTLRLSNQFDDVDEMTVYLLCDGCDRGASFHQGSLFRGWSVMDSETYDVTFTRSSRDDNYYDRYDNDDYDLQVRSVDYEYDIRGNDVTVEFTTVVRNIGDRDTILERLEYEVEIDGDRFSDRDYDLDHVRTDCDDRGVDRDDETNLPIDEGDECEVTVEFTFDERDVEDEYVEIFVELDARRDDNGRNDDDSVRFYVR